jgi:hypothetical protein
MALSPYDIGDMLPRHMVIDLANLSQDELSALRQECIRRGIPMARLLADFVTEAVDRLIPTKHESQD